MKTLITLLLSATTALGSLKWESTSAVLKPHPLQGVAPVVFNYSNVGKESVSITDMVASCGCLVPEKKPAPIPPGSKGELKVEFDLFNRTGRQKKRLVVKTSDGKSVVLNIEADIPKAYQVSPTLMTLSPKTAGTKTATLKNKTRTPMPIKSVVSSSEKIKAELQCIKEGFEYAVTVSQLDTNHNHRAVIRITPETPEGIAEVKTYKFYVFSKKYDPADQK